MGSSSWCDIWSASATIPAWSPVRGMFVAQSVTPQAKVLAEARGIVAIEVDYDGLREAEDTELRLFDLR